MLTVPEELRPAFAAAGWNPTRSSSETFAAATRATDRCRALIGEFGGLRVGKAGPGTEVAASDVHFYSTQRPEVSGLSLPWLSLIGTAAAFATAHNDHMILLVNDAGEFFVYTDPDEKLYNTGKNFGELLKRLLWGYTLGVPLRRDA